MRVEILRTDGTREQRDVQPINGSIFQALYPLAGCDTFDSVNLRDGRVMLVDDNGWECEMVDLGGGRFQMKPLHSRKPVNQEATKLYHSLCAPGTTHQIVGDVIIANDEDFA